MAGAGGSSSGGGAVVVVHHAELTLRKGGKEKTSRQ